MSTTVKKHHHSSSSEDLLGAPLNDEMPPLEQSRHTSTDSKEEKLKGEEIATSQLYSPDKDGRRHHSSSDSGQTSPSKPEDGEEAYDGPRPAAIVVVSAVCTLLQFIVFVLATVATPLDMYETRPSVNKAFLVFPANSSAATDSSRQCLSMWGSKPCGSKMNYKDLPHHGFACKGVYRLMIGGAAASICAIAFSFITFILALLTAAGRSEDLQSTTAAGMLSMVATTFTCLAFAFVSGARNKGCGFNSGVLYHVIRTDYRYASGYGLVTAAFCVQFASMVMLLAVMCL